MRSVGVTRLCSMLAAAAAIAVFASAAAFAVRFGYADYLSFSSSLSERRRSTSLVGGDTEFQLRRADLEQVYGHDAAPEMEIATSLSPLDAGNWIQLGLNREEAGDTATAERCLLQAAAVSKLYLPRWTLANFYLRRADAAGLYRWGRAALEVSLGDMSPLYRMYWTLSTDAARIANAIPARPEVELNYFAWLLDQGRLDAAAPLARRLIDTNPVKAHVRLLVYCDRLISASHLDEAAALWNRMAGPLGTVSFTGPGVVNGGFRSLPTDLAFDWAVYRSPGIEAEFLQPGMRFTFSGSEPEYAPLLSQVVLVAPERKYRVGCDCESSGIPAASGLRWRAMTGSRDLGAPDFETPSGVRSIRLTLVYERQPGTVRIEGSFLVRRVWLNPAT